MKHVSIKISGKVQGVFFRASTKDIADQMNIRGFVRNERDGSVFIEAEGEEENLERFIAWCHHGPSHAVVEKVLVNEQPVQNLTRFDVRR